MSTDCSGNVEVSKLAGGSSEETMNAASNAPVKKQKKASSGYTMSLINTPRKEMSGLRCTDVFSISDFLSQHAGGELAILTLTGEDAIAEFDMIHPPDVVVKYVPDAIFGVVGNGKAKKAKRAAKSSLPVATGQGDAVENLKA